MARKKERPTKAPRTPAVAAGDLLSILSTHPLFGPGGYMDVQHGHLLAVVELFSRLYPGREPSYAEIKGHFAAEGISPKVCDAMSLEDVAARLRTALVPPANIGEAAPGEAKDDAVDGPIEPDGFRFQGRAYHGLARKPFFALLYLWGQPNKVARLDDLAGPVWEDHAYPPDAEAVRGLRRDLNRFFRAHQLPWKSFIKNQCLALRSGDPPPCKKKPARKKR